MALSGMITFGLLIVFIDCLNGQITYPEPLVFRAKDSWTTDEDMALSGMITFGLFVVLIGCLNGQPTHPIPFLIRASGRTARIQCRMDSSKLTSNALHWYRLKDQAFQRLMYFEAGSKTGKSDPGVPSRYAGSVKADLVTLTISTLESSDAGSYYCALWSEDNTVLTKEEL
ncbi:hypothetical protein Q8A67_008990 [Cirrhinus molitorella]|uniref:Ig-like domain-containing protein n=1 Tax=Cirrhinus molitorella TaxID=172907 RepID=A0AA88TR83_9TELE|nr:hypothetical protein Q8A67_008990 [Cirrhinus molitorella]